MTIQGCLETDLWEAVRDVAIVKFGLGVPKVQV